MKKKIVSVSCEQLRFEEVSDSRLRHAYSFIKRHGKSILKGVV